MKIELKKFGTTLTSRQTGREAYNAIQPVLAETSNGEPIEIDFSEVVTFSPSWADEFITPLQEQYGDRVLLLDTDNPAVHATMSLLREIQ